MKLGVNGPVHCEGTHQLLFDVFRCVLLWAELVHKTASFPFVPITKVLVPSSISVASVCRFIVRVFAAGLFQLHPELTNTKHEAFCRASVVAYNQSNVFKGLQPIIDAADAYFASQSSLEGLD